MSTVRTVYELRSVIQCRGFGDFAPKPKMFDELQFDVARRQFEEWVRTARSRIGREQTYFTEAGGSVNATPHTIAVELWQFKAGTSSDGGVWAGKGAIVGESPEKGEPGLREVVTQENAA